MTKILALIIVLAAGYINNASASWQAYVDDNLVGSNVSKAAIFGLDGTAWATSAGFSVSPSEASAIAAGAQNPSSLGGGLYLEGVNYMVLRADESSIYVRQGQNGACICKTNQAVLVGMYGENQTAGNCNATVEKLADYLRENGY
jgi:profilin